MLDPNLKAPVTSSVVAGIDRELIPNLAVGVNYSYTRTSRLFGNFTGTITPRVGVTLADYAPGSGFSGTIPLDGGVRLQRADVHPEPGGDYRRRQRLRDDQRARLLHRLSTASR